MSDDTDKLVNRVKALLALAEDQKGKPEGEVAAKIAEKLMRQHAITQDQLQEKEQIVMLNREIGRSNWLRDLFNVVAKFCSCKVWVVTGTRQMGLAGHASDLEICEYLFDLIRMQIERECELYLGRLKNRDQFNPFGQAPIQTNAEGGKGTAHSFKMSAVSGVSYKLGQIKRASESEDQQGTALVLSRARQVEDWVATQIRLYSRSAAGYRPNQDGFNAGKNVRLSAGVGSAGTPAGIGPAPKQLKG